MNFKKEIGTKGVVHVVQPKSNSKPEKEFRIIDEENLHRCLNCTKKECNGNCIEVRRKRNETKSRNN